MSSRPSSPQSLPGSPSDADLVLKARQGDAYGFQELVRRYLNQLQGFLRYLHAPPDKIEDLAQESFLKAFRSLEGFDAQRPFLNWLLSIARNTVYDEWDRHRREQELERSQQAEPTTTPGVEDQVIARQTALELLEALTDPDRVLLELRFYRDLPFAEISQLTGETEGGLRVRFHRLIQRLRLTAEKRNQHGA